MFIGAKGETLSLLFIFPASISANSTNLPKEPAWPVFELSRAHGVFLNVYSQPRA